MFEEKTFLMPDYYNDFKCKMGECRHPCCEGWPISISVEDYFKLMGSQCSEGLRKQLDKAIKIQISPTPDKYAQITPQYDGKCTLHMDDGRCAIHAELGEEALSDVCRLYPRGIRIEPDYECSCANSCEATIEAFHERTSPLTFIKSKKVEYLPPFGKRYFTYPLMGMEQELKLFFISIIQNRKIDLYKRFILLGEALGKVESAVDKQDKQALKSIVSSNPLDDIPNFEANKEHLKFGIDTIKELLDFIDGRSESVRLYGEEALKLFDSTDDVVDIYMSAKDNFETSFPNWETFFENMIVNHMFFEQFPFQDRPVRLWHEFSSLCATYALLRFLSIGYISKHNDKIHFIDMCAAVFRLVDHTSFDSYTSKTLSRLNCNSPQKLFDLISL